MDEKYYSAISLKQPFAELIRRKTKTIETRKWSTKYTGPILIHASKTQVPVGALDEITMGFIEEILNYEKPQFTLGAFVAVANIVDCVPFEEHHIWRACCGLYTGFAFILEDIKAIEPIPYKGELGIFATEILRTDVKFI